MQTQRNLRRLPLAGACNTRELGGYPCADGGTTKWGSFLRSDGTHALAQQDIVTLTAYGITDTVDLRSTQEAQRDPSRLNGCGDIALHHVPMLDNIMSGKGEHGFPDTLGEMYVGMLENGGPDFVKVFRIFAAAKGGCLFHCAVGKDRTGMVAMLLLKLAGVAEVDIVADYVVSEVYLAKLFAPRIKEYEAYGVSTNLLRSEAPNIEQALAELESKYGGAKKYLLDAGLTEYELAAVLKKLK